MEIMGINEIMLIIGAVVFVVGAVGIVVTKVRDEDSGNGILLLLAWFGLWAVAAICAVGAGHIADTWVK